MNPFAAFFASLSKGVKAAIPYFTSAAKSDIPVSQIMQNARDAGFSFRTQQARDVIQTLRNNVVTSEATLRQARVLGNDVPLDPRTYGVTLGRPLLNFSYLVQRTLRGRESGQFDVGYITVISNDPLSVNQILGDTEKMTTGSCNPLFEPIEIVDLKVVEARRSSTYEV